MEAMDQDTKDLLDLLVTQTGMDPNAWKEKSLVRTTDAGNLAFNDRDADFPYTDRFVNALAVFLANVELFAVSVDKETGEPRMDDKGNLVEYLHVNSIRTIMHEIDALAQRLDDAVQRRLHEVLRSESLRELEASWRSLDDLSSAVSSTDVIIDFIDVTKDELGSDL